jgi:DNA-binding NarL/FixJ family response regulator
MSNTLKRRVLIADDHILLAEGLASLLSSEYEVVGCSSSGHQLLKDAVRLKPDLVVLDISMPDLNGIDASVQLRHLVPGAQIVFVTQQVDPLYVRRAFESGAAGYVVKQSASSELRNALRSVISGQSYISPGVRETVPAASFPAPRAPRTDWPACELTPRQLEVLQMVAEGRTVKEISSALSISPKTVEFHKKALMDQTGLRTTAELTRYAIQRGIV